MPEPSDPIIVACPACGKQYRLTRAAIGKFAKCSCGDRFQVQASASQPARAKPRRARPREAQPAQPRPPQPAPSGPTPAVAEEAGTTDAAVLSAIADLAARVGSDDAETSTPTTPVISGGSQSPDGSSPKAAVTCAFHPQQPAAARCAKCKTPLCQQCALKTKSGKHVCRPCAQARKTAKSAGSDSAAPRSRSPVAPQPTARPPIAPAQPAEEQDEVYDAEVVQEESDPDGIDFGALSLPAAPVPAPAPAASGLPAGMDPLGPALPSAPQVQPNPFTPGGFAGGGAAPVGGAPNAFPTGPTNPYAPAAPVGGRRQQVPQYCKQHPASAVVHHCSVCEAPICRTCTFTFPPNVICCPDCATETTPQLSPHRKYMLYASFGCALFDSIFMALACAGLLAPLTEVPLGGVLIEIAIMGPLCAGIGLAFGSYNSSEGNPWTLWAAGIWNTLGLLAWFAFLALIVIQGGA